jgi:hypothetical protein
VAVGLEIGAWGMSNWIATPATSYIYVIGSLEKMDRVKIGLSWNPIDRMKHLQTGSPTTLHLWATYPCPRQKVDDLERFVHNKLHESRLRGEWFKIHPRDAIEKVGVLVSDFLDKKNRQNVYYEPYFHKKTLETVSPNMRRKLAERGIYA